MGAGGQGPASQQDVQTLPTPQLLRAGGRGQLHSSPLPDPPNTALGCAGPGPGLRLAGVRPAGSGVLGPYAARTAPVPRLDFSFLITAVIGPSDLIPALDII